MSSLAVTYRVLTSFDDPVLTPQVWNHLVKNGSGNYIFMTWQWQRTWWEVFGRGDIKIVVAERDNSAFAIAPLFADEGMLFWIGSGGSDYLDFIGDVSNPEVLEQMLQIAVEQVRDFVGLRFYHIPAHSKTPAQLNDISKWNNWKYFDEGEMIAPFMDIIDNSQHALDATRKKSLIRHENWFTRNGDLKVEHLTTEQEIIPHLDDFFEQHINRWAVTNFPSLFLDPKQKEFYRKLCHSLSDTGWLRFTRIIWKEQSIAFHFGFNYDDNFFWYKPTFDIALYKHSPGEVLLRQLLLRAIEEQAHIFDFGLGDEEFKKRFATGIRTVSTCGLYPLSVLAAV